MERLLGTVRLEHLELHCVDDRDQWVSDCRDRRFLKNRCLDPSRRSLLDEHSIGDPVLRVRRILQPRYEVPSSVSPSSLHRISE